MKTKIFSITASLFILAIIVSSCTSPNSVLVKKDGKWMAISTVTTSAGGTSVTNVDTSTYAFKDDGTGTATYGSTTINFNWNWDKKDKKIEFTVTLFGITTIKDYEVVEKKANSEKWTYESSETNGSGVTTTTHEDISLTRE